MDILRDKDGRSNIRLIILVFVVLSGIVAALLYFPPILTKTEPEKTSGDLTFTDGAGNPLSGSIELRGDGVSSGLKSNVNYISWTNVPNIRIYYNVQDTKSVSANLRISGNSPGGRVAVENYGINLPPGLNLSAPGSAVKYVQVSAIGVSFAEAEISIKYTDAELNGIDENNLVIYRYDGNAQAWSELSTTADANNNILSTTVNSLSFFALSTRIPDKIEVHDTKRMPVVSDIKTYDEAKNVKKAEKASALSAADIPVRGELEVDALKTKNVAVKLKVKTPGSGEIILDDYGGKNPVAVAPPGTTIKYVDISAVNINFDSAEVRIHYTNAELGGADERALIVYHWNGASWDALPTTVDLVNHILTATTTSLSPFAVSGGTGGQAQIWVATNRYVVLDDWIAGTTSTNFVNPNVADATTLSFFTGTQTTIGAKALLIDSNGFALSGKTVNFTIYNPNSGVYSTGTNVTDSSGVASFYNSLDNANFYGNWTVKADYSGISKNTSFIYNWWGCAWGGSCTGGHASVSPEVAGIATANSPYTKSDEKITSWQAPHYPPGLTTIWGDNWCTICHQNYDGNTTPTNTVGTVKGWNPPDVHRKIRCDNASCHDPGASFANHNAGSITIGSCTSASCHPLRPDISMKSTLNGVVSNYSNSSSGGLYDDYHTPNSTVPCIICHGPMHNISKPNASLRYIRDTNTDSSHCTACHSSYKKHNESNASFGGVNCTLCHSDDVHAIKVFAQNATYVTLNKNNPNPARGNCTNCHQNATFYGALKSQSNATLQTGRDPPQVPVPLEHSEASNAGQKWNQTPGYWNNSNQVTWCWYCHGNTSHNATALGRPSLFDGNNTVNSTISASTNWCASCHWQGYSSVPNTYNDTVNTFNFPNEPLLVPPEFTGNSTYTNAPSYPGYFNHSGVSKDDSTCKSCHGSLAGSVTTITGFLHNVAIGAGGGPDCISCHDYGKTGAQHRINNSDMKRGEHANINSNATNASGIPADNKKCWGCHTSNGSQPADMGDKTSGSNAYKCYECHNAASKPYANVSNAPNVTEHFKGGIDIDAATSAIDNSSSCDTCHNLTEMKVSYTEDSSLAYVYFSSASHYGRSRANDTQVRQGASTNCSYCHQNTSTAFTTAMADPTWNSSIANHSTNYNSTNPGCTNSSCHNTGWIHNSTLNKPVSNDTLCKTCHGTGGSAATNNKTEHKNLYCTICHANSTAGALAGKDIHPIKYLTKSNNFSTSNSSAVDCTTCHQTSNVDSSLSR